MTSPKVWIEDSNGTMIEFDPSINLRALEWSYIQKAIAHYGGNKYRAANSLGITVKTLYNRIHENDAFGRYAKHPGRRD